MTIVYGFSGIFLNHRHDFNPDYKIFVTDFKVDLPRNSGFTEQNVRTALESLERDVVYKKYYFNNQGFLKVFIENGEIVINPQTGEGTMNYLQKRPVIFRMNKLHKATIGTLWKWVSDTQWQ